MVEREVNALTEVCRTQTLWSAAFVGGSLVRGYASVFKIVVRIHV